jgi:hypothetical protein
MIPTEDSSHHTIHTIAPSWFIVKVSLYRVSGHTYANPGDLLSGPERKYSRPLQSAHAKIYTPIKEALQFIGNAMFLAKSTIMSTRA